MRECTRLACLIDSVYSPLSSIWHLPSLGSTMPPSYNSNSIHH